MQSPYEYIGEYNVRNVPAFVFEKKIDDFNNYQEPKEGEESENDQYLHFFRNNTNGVVSNHATVTHYYPKNPSYWSNNTEKFDVPMKIEIRLFDNHTRLNEVGKLTINVASFKRNAVNYEMFDTSDCVENEYDYNWFLVKFDDTAKNAKKYQKYTAQIQNSFRSILNISPLR